MAAPTAPASLEERLDLLAGQLDEIRAELRDQREDRDRWRELADDFAPVAVEAMDLTIRHLDADRFDFAEVGSLARAVLRNAAVLESWIEPLRAMAALADELGPLAPPAVASLNARLQQLDERGYFSFAREATAIVDKVVTSFSEEDVRLLGENIVLILQTVKQMTQPEVMGLLGRTAVTIQEGESQDVAKAPSAISLIKQMHDPLARQGLARVLATLRAVGAAPSTMTVQTSSEAAVTTA